jgi:cysteinyl-tRNA synthetase
MRGEVPANLSLCLLLSVMACTFISCAGYSDDGAGAPAVPGDQASPLAGVTVTSGSLPPSLKWAYMLQNDVSNEITGTDFNVLVMDYTKDGADDSVHRYTTAEMSRIKNVGATRVALAYLSIGEAEDYRYYFDPAWTDEGEGARPDRDAPAWLGRGNPCWEGNYKVRYWSEEWQLIVLGYLDKIIAYGFDGAYLDVVDGFEYWSDEENGEGYFLSESDTAARMIDFVGRIATHARAKDADFLVVPQNGERLLGYDESGDYLKAIDGIGVEDLYYNERTAVDPEATAERVDYLDQVLRAGKPVIVVDYVCAGFRDAVVDDFLAKAGADGYFPYAARTDRELDRLVTFPGQGE